MKRTAVFKLLPTREQFVALLRTMEAFNLGCSRAVELAEGKANKIVLHHAAYRPLRDEFGLSAQMATRSIGKACEAIKAAKPSAPLIDPHGAITYDNRIMSFKGADRVSLLTLDGRQLIPMQWGSYQGPLMAWPRGQADLVLKKGVFYLHVTVDLPDVEMIDAKECIGIDMGIVEIATDSDGVSFSGEPLTRQRKLVKEHRRQLQKRKTRSAYKRLQKQSSRHGRRTCDANHCISKAIVQKASSQSKAIAVEVLKGIRNRVHGSKQMRWLLGNWAFSQLGAFIRYKAEALGIPVVEVDPAYTSQTCSQCGHCERANRKSQSEFKCLHCGFVGNADINAAVNIKARGDLSYTLMFRASA